LAVTNPPAEGLRTAYAETPDALRAWVDDAMGSPVVDAVTQPGGFSPGVAARLRCTDGSQAFCKAVSADVNEFAASAHRNEQRISAALPAAAPVPRLLSTYDDGTWVALLLQDINGRQPALPWRPAELTRVIAALDDLGDVLTPSPLLDVPPVGTPQDRDFWGWRELSEAGADRSGLPRWAATHLGRLAALEPAWVAASDGNTLLHADIRADNLLLTSDQVWVVDWPWACTGTSWVDIANLAPSVQMQGGPPAAEVFASSRRTRSADRREVTAYVCALAGYFVGQSRQPAPAGLPTVRAFQAAQGDVALTWLAELTGWK
jgi:aminoglycoside phosphotransferase (APT) family kinase protein